MSGQSPKIQKWLYPLSWLYGMGVAFRNKLFDWKILRSKSFNVPVICIGNIAVGGTGKTPHTEYIVRLLKKDFSVAVLSRGYKRQTSGYVLSDSQSTAATIGDEPCQIKSKFPDITVAVDAKRTRGIENLIELKDSPIDVILLDDAFQHRYVEAGMNILLTDYNRLFTQDALLPAGRLRESAKGKHRAQMVIVTKCPVDIKPIDFNIIGKQLRLFPYQQLYFTRFKYGQLAPVFPKEATRNYRLEELRGDEQILLLTGIVSPDGMVEQIRRYNKNIHLLNFSDHHNFTKKDLKKISKQFSALASTNKLIITTEKDAVRLISNPDLGDDLKRNLYILPIEVEFLQNQQNTFNQNIINYVRKNKRNGSLSEK